MGKTSKADKAPKATSIKSTPGWTLVSNDEFDGKYIDATKWGFDIGNGFFD